MKVQQGADYFIDYHKANSKKYVRNQVFVLTRFLDEFGDRTEDALWLFGKIH